MTTECTHDHYETLEAVRGSVFDDHDTIYVQCRDCKGLYTVNQPKNGRGEDWSPMTHQEMMQFAEPEPPTYKQGQCMLCGDLEMLVVETEVCRECWHLHDEPSASRVDSILEARFDAMMERSEPDHDGERDAMREAGRIR